MSDISTTNTQLDYLIPILRLTIGDTSVTPRYIDAWLSVALVAAIKTLSKWWNYRYLVDGDQVITRNTATYTFPPNTGSLILPEDEEPIVIMAAITILQGSLENSSWSIASWRDMEVSYSNIESGKLKDSNLKRLLDRLNALVTSPTRKLANAKVAPLPGFAQNPWETSTEL